MERFLPRIMMRLVKLAIIGQWVRSRRGSSVAYQETAMGMIRKAQAEEMARRQREGVTEEDLEAYLEELRNAKDEQARLAVLSRPVQHRERGGEDNA